ncbi:MAG: UvrD-helicase domain-containing protein [Bdellovibrionales bacterium]
MSSFQYKNILYKAGAGAGKTTQLTQFITESALEFKKDQERFPKLVVTTFTRKATQELKERLMAKAIEAENFELTQYFSSSHQIFISTIHGVLHLFLNRFGFRLGLDPALQILDAVELHRVGRKTLKHLFASEPRYVSLLDFFTLNQLLETLTIYAREKAMRPDLKPYLKKEIERAFQEKLQSLAQDLKALQSQILSETSHESWMEYARWLEQISSSYFKKWDYASFRDSFEAKRKPSNSKKNPAVTEELSDRVTEIMDEVKELTSEKYDPTFWESYEEVALLYEELAQKYVTQFEANKKQLGGISTEDLELLALESIHKHPDIAQAFAAEWDYWLIDEYQDTSPIQEKIIHHLKGGKPAFVVGDPQQSIYLFRGARAELFQEKLKSFEKEKEEIKYLTTNYRSDPRLVRFFNEFFDKFGKHFSPMVPKDLSEEHQFGQVKFLQASTPEKEKESIAYQIRQWLNEGVRAEQICVLAKTNGTLREIAKELYLKQIPCHLHSSQGFSKRREVIDAISLLQFLVNPHDNLNLLRLLRSPFCRLSDQTLVDLNLTSPSSLWAYMQDAQDTDTREIVSHLNLALEESDRLGIRGAFEKNLVRFGYLDFSQDYDPTGRRESNLWKLLKRLSAAEADPGFNYYHFVTQILKSGAYEDDGDATPALEPQRVNLMTIHHSKGLQFSHVIVPQLHRKSRPMSTPGFVFNEEDGRWSLSLPLGEDSKRQALFVATPVLQEMKTRDMKEQERVLYVALTRAVHAVMLSWVGDGPASSLARLIQWDLTPGKHEREGYTYEVIDQIAETSTASTEANSAQIRSLVKTQVSASDRRISVTQVLNQSSRKENRAKADTDQKWILQKILNSAQRGITLHKLLETLKYTQGTSFQIEEHVKNILGESGQELAPAMAKMMNFVMKQEAVPVENLIHSGSVEWGFLLKHKGFLIEGQIDLWGELKDTLWVIDYKSGTSDDLSKAMDQLKIYSYALKQCFPESQNKKMMMAVIYPAEEKVFLEEAPQLSQVKKDLDRMLES